MRILSIFLAVLVALSGVAPRALAQKADQKNQKKEKVKKKLRAYRAMVLVDELDLDENTATKLMPILDKYDDEFVKIAKKNLELRGKLDAATDDKDLDTVIDDLVANQRARWDLDEARFKEVRKVLTAKQSARILVILPEIDRKILQGAKKAVKEGKIKVKGAGKGKKAKARKARPDGDVMDPFAEP